MGLISKPVVVAAAVALAVGGVVGGVIGYTRGFDAAFGMLETEVRGELVFRSDVLCRLRLGKPDEAIRILEMQLDTAVATIPQNRAVNELPPQALTALLAAKVYRTAHPGGTPEAAGVLNQLSLPTDPSFCDRSGVRAMWETLQKPKAEGDGSR